MEKLEMEGRGQKQIKEVEGGPCLMVVGDLGEQEHLLSCVVPSL